jgi:hypothetical protein
MVNFKVKVYSSDIKEDFDFECYPNDEPIEIGDYLLYFFAGIADVSKCENETEKSEVNKHDRPRKENCVMDLTHGFWRNCYKIKNTNFDLTTV